MSNGRTKAVAVSVRLPPSGVWIALIRLATNSWSVNILTGVRSQCRLGSRPAGFAAKWSKFGQLSAC